MRKLIYAINLSLDGCCDHTKMSAGEDVHEYHTDLLRRVDVLIYGRKTYQLMFPFWSDVAKNNSGQTKAMNDFAQVINAVSKVVVFSKSLERAGEKQTTIVRSGLKEEILKLKQEQGKDMIVGGVDLPSQLMQLGLVDEYHFVIQPVVVGEGVRVAEGVRMQDKLKLVETKTFPSGGIALRYLK